MAYHLCGSQAVLSAAVTTAVAFGFRAKSKKVSNASGSCSKVVAAFGYSAGGILPAKRLRQDSDGQASQDRMRCGRRRVHGRSCDLVVRVGIGTRHVARRETR